MPAQTAPSPLRERGNIRLWWSFRSLYVPCYSVTTWPVNVPGWLSRHHPGDPGFRRKIAASRYLRLIPSGYRVGHEPASMQATPSRRIPAPRPGLQETPQRFTAGPGHRCKPSVILRQRYRFCFQITGDPSPLWERARVRASDLTNT